nr:immunoglobulin light chain junction region [Macaca mulatta]
CLQGYKPPYSF